VPLFGLERLCPLDLELAVLLRALLSEDDELSEQCGALELTEEDLGLISYACPSKSPYQLLLRGFLQRIAEETRP
jgi:Na+-transporting NADH:ubiquinone oxidoreductase subunit A